jgi:hypothetical protein
MVDSTLIFDDRVKAVKGLGTALERIIEEYAAGNALELRSAITSAYRQNPWFTPDNIILALGNWAAVLRNEEIDKWISSYPQLSSASNYEKTIGVVNAGNVPFVGLHDLICILMSGKKYQGKNASNDTYLLPYIADLLREINPAFTDKITFTVKLNNIDAVIATGSNNSSRYFEYYFGKYPHIIRKNRNAVAILTGNESETDLNALGFDIFSYFGLGCRNVSKLYVPEGYDFSTFFKSIYSFSEIANHSKYMNNLDFNNSVFLLKLIPFLQNGFLIIREEKQIASPVSVLHYEYFNSAGELGKNLYDIRDQLQCIVTGDEKILNNKQLGNICVGFGETQTPKLWDYADGVDVMSWSLNI